jgi:hypothetical protein
MRKTFDYQCAACGETEIHLVEEEDRNNNQSCLACGGPSIRMWTSNFSTEKVSSTMPAAAAKGRFDHLRRRQELKKCKSDARVSGDRQSEKQIDAEIKKL